MFNAYLTGSLNTLTFGNEIMTQKILVWPMALILAFVVTGCSSSGGEMLPDTIAKQSGSYIVGPGDKLEIFVWRNPELSKKVTVRPDGKISSPLITEIDVAGLEVPVIAGLIESELSKYIRTPQVSVIVTNFNSTVDQQIRVIGSAGNPRVLPYRSGMTLLDVMIAVQGLAQFADGNAAKLIRKENGVDKSYSIKLDSLINDGDITMNRAVLPGDTIIIPESTF
jgi:polysaccharide export outer membrane protein